MDAKLVVAKGKTTVKEIPLGNMKTIIGRRNDCSLRIPSPLVSRQHCELQCAGDRLVVRDLGSSNGTLVNGARVKQKELKSGDTLGVGPITFIVRLGDSPVSPGDTARPVGVAQEAADFIVSEEDATTDLADFIVAEDSGEAADFVVAEASDDTADLADFVAGEETRGEADPDYTVAAEVSGDADTIHSMSDVAAKKGAKSAPEAEDAAASAEQPKSKPGFFGRLFKKKEKKPEKEAAQAEPAPADKGTKKAKRSAEPAPAKPAPAKQAAAAEPESDFFVADDDGTSETAKPVGDDELADFLMGLNEKDQ